MASVEHRNHALAFLKKAEEYIASAEDNFNLERHTPAAGDAIHAGISAKDAIVTMLTGSTSKANDHEAAARELRRALDPREDAASAERALRQVVSMKADVEYGTTLLTSTKTEPLLRRARSVVDLAIEIVRLDGWHLGVASTMIRSAT